MSKPKKPAAKIAPATVYICSVGDYAYAGETMEDAYANLLATNCDVDPPPPSMCTWFRGVRVAAQITEVSND